MESPYDNETKNFIDGSEKMEITIICEEETKKALEKFFEKLCLNSQFEFNYKDFKAYDEKSLKKVLFDNYYNCAILVLPYSPQVLKDLLEENSFIIFSQRIARHHIFYYQWCKEKKFADFLKNLYTAIKYRFEQ